ncbi:MAG TPA: pyridoxamine 5'-phosphate oxidase family protein [Acidimicrobiales bacterium]|nr:pyridoxamine 5'-phosphate oxidase family protein [Acidimicrobiales bacterium]
MSIAPVGRSVSHPDWMARRGGVIPWEEVERKLAAARNYWVASLRANGLPHTRPVWGVWFDQRLLLSAGGGYWMSRNLRRHSLVSAHPEEAEGLVVVVEGRAVAVEDRDHLERAVAAYNEKYDWDITEEEFDGSMEVAPDRVFAWRTGGRDFHDYDATRFDYSQ